VYPSAGASHYFNSARDMGLGILGGQGDRMIEDEEARPVKTAWAAAGRVEKPPLDPLSVADLRAYIAELQAEIARAEAAIASKDGARGHADSFFRIP